MKVFLEDYKKVRNMHVSVGMNVDLCPVDANGAYVCLDPSQKDKEGAECLNEAHQCNLDRFGLNEMGVGGE